MTSLPESDRSPVRLGPGDFTVNPNPMAWQHFLDAMIEVEPEALWELEQRTLPIAIESLALSTYLAMTREWGMGEGRLDLDYTEPLGAEIRRWLRRWYVADCDWICAAVVWTLADWIDAVLSGNKPEGRLIPAPILGEDGILYGGDRALSWSPLEGADPALGVIRLDLEVEFNLRTERRAAIRDRILDYVKQEVNRRLDDAERASQLAGLAKTPRKENQRHFVWLARYQVKRESFGVIHRTDRAARQSIETAVKETAALIGLPLRDPDPAGRPRASE